MELVFKNNIFKLIVFILNPKFKFINDEYLLNALTLLNIIKSIPNCIILIIAKENSDLLNIFVVKLKNKRNLFKVDNKLSKYLCSTTKKI